MKQLILIAIFSLCHNLAKCQVDTASHWSYTSDHNQMTGDSTYYAETSDNNNDVSATITLRHRGKKDDEVILSLYKAVANFKAYDIGTAIQVTIKFDSDKPEKIVGYPPSDGSFDSMFLGRVRNTIKRLKTCKKFLIQIELYNKGNVVFEFKTAGLKWDYK